MLSEEMTRTESPEKECASHDCEGCGRALVTRPMFSVERKRAVTGGRVGTDTLSDLRGHKLGGAVEESRLVQSRRHSARGPEVVT